MNHLELAGFDPNSCVKMNPTVGAESPTSGALAKTNVLASIGAVLSFLLFSM